MTETHRVRVVLECEVEITDISMASMQARREEWLRTWGTRGLSKAFPMETPSEADLADLRMLQEALRANPEYLTAWVMDEVAFDLDFRGVEEAAPTEGSHARILMPVIESLPMPQRHKFREAIANDTFHDLAEDFFQSFAVTIRSVEMS